MALRIVSSNLPPGRRWSDGQSDLMARFCRHRPIGWLDQVEWERRRRRIDLDLDIYNTYVSVWYLIDELLEVGCGRIDALQIVVQGELCQGFPRRGEGVNLNRIDPAASSASSSSSVTPASARRRLAVSHWTGRDQRDALHRTESQLPSVLLIDRNTKQKAKKQKPF